MGDKIKAYLVATTNGRKVGIALEELGLSFETHKINFGAKEQKSDWYVKNVNPNGKIPAIVDPHGPGGKEIRVFESGAVLTYLAEKAGGKLYPADNKYEILAWMFLVNSGLAPNLANYNTFVASWDKNTPPEQIAASKFTEELSRVLGVINEQLMKNAFLAGGEYSIADINMYGWLGDPSSQAIIKNYPAISAWAAKVGERPAVKRGIKHGA